MKKPAPRSLSLLPTETSAPSSSRLHRRHREEIPKFVGWGVMVMVGSLQPVGSEGVLHCRVGEHQVAVQHVQSQRIHPERIVQRERIHLKAGDVRQSAGDLLRQAWW